MHTSTPSVPTHRLSATTTLPSPEFSHEPLMTMASITPLQCPSSEFSACCHQDCARNLSHLFPFAFETCRDERYDGGRQHERSLVFVTTLSTLFQSLSGPSTEGAAAIDQILNEDDFDDKTS